MSNISKHSTTDWHGLRKAVAVHALHRLGMAQEGLARMAGVRQGTVSKWQNRGYESAPSLDHLVAISLGARVPLTDMLAAAIEEEDRLRGEGVAAMLNDRELEAARSLRSALACEGKEAVRPGRGDKAEHPGHLLSKFERACYLGFFLSTDTQRPEHLVLETGPAGGDGVPGSARIMQKAENPYRVAIVPPTHQGHLFSFMWQGNGKLDKGLMVFHADEDMQGPCKCCSGILVSEARKEGDMCLQWVALVRVGDLPADAWADALSSECHSRLNAEDKAFEGSYELSAVDACLLAFLKEELPSQNQGVLRFEGVLRQRQRLC